MSRYLHPTSYPQINKKEIENLFLKDFRRFYEKLSDKKIVAWSTIPSKNKEDPFIYVGIGGYLYTILRILESEKCLELINQELDIDKDNLQVMANLLDQTVWSYYNKKYQNRERTISYFIGETGLLLLNIKMYFFLNNEKKIFENFGKILAISNFVLSSEDTDSEILYGVAGTLIAFLDLAQFLTKNLSLFTQKEIVEDFLKNLDKSIVDIFEFLINRGVSDFKKHQKKQFRLFYTFCNKEYLGAAHGLMGILFALLLTIDLKKDLIFKLKFFEEYFVFIFDSILFCSYFRDNEGNFFSNTHSNNNSLIQFCHGAIGGVYLFLLANKVLSAMKDKFKEKYKMIDFLDIAHKAADVIYKKGILKKGFNLCHGITGNAYAFLYFTKFSFIDQSQKNEYWKRAVEFLSFKENKFFIQIFKDYEEEHFCNNYVFSLMEGLAGDICLEMDLIEGNYRFPCFDL